MDFILFSFSIGVFLLGVALFSNRARAAQDPPFELKPNCLLTRYPLLFVTGPRSVFYFSKYWNIYTSYLAEHGYEVFTLHLPWSKSEDRLQRMEEFLSQNHSKPFHLFVDAPTFKELEVFLKSSGSSLIASLTEVHDPQTSTNLTAPVRLGDLRAFPFPFAQVECVQPQKSKFFFELAYRGHRLFFKNPEMPSLSCLGASPLTQFENSMLLLERAQTLAEMDLRGS